MHACCAFSQRQPEQCVSLSRSATRSAAWAYKTTMPCMYHRMLDALQLIHRTRCGAVQRLADVHRGPPQLPSGRQALAEIPMPQLRRRGLPHAPLPKAGNYCGPASMRLKPMSTGQPPMQSVVNVQDSLALSTWAAAGRRTAQTDSAL